MQHGASDDEGELVEEGSESVSASYANDDTAGDEEHTYDGDGNTILVEE